MNGPAQWHRMDDGQQECCRKCDRTPLECAKAVAPECADMQRRLLQSSERATEVQPAMPVLPKLQNDNWVIKAIDQIKMKGVGK